jgi:hypothetical protein
MELYGEGGVRRPGVALSAQTRRRLMRAGAAAAGAAYLAPGMRRIAYGDGIRCAGTIVFVSKTIDSVTPSGTCAMSGKIIVNNCLGKAITITSISDQLLYSGNPVSMSNLLINPSPPQSVANGNSITFTYSFNFSGVQGNNITLVNRATVTYTDGSNTLTAEASTSGNFSC